MTTRRTLVVLMLLLVSAVIFLRFRSETNIQGIGDQAKGANGQAAGASGAPATKSILSEAKLREREPKKELGIDEMFAGLKVVLPGLTEFPEKTLQERMLATNALLKKTGIKLRLGMDETLHPSPHLLEKNVPAFSQQNATLGDILLQAESALKMSHYLSQDGSVLLNEGSGG
ncbi:MAG: hypothetical protein EOP83_28180 [Verrucomicrobiaceae bacterium]|nr:MAG: hypothetical protein EOP83_28180 [Verrucomicrobiaceae bacterium]